MIYFIAIVLTLIVFGLIGYLGLTVINEFRVVISKCDEYADSLYYLYRKRDQKIQQILDNVERINK